MRNRDYKPRVFVVYRSNPLMPMRFGRAMKYVSLGKARIRIHRKLGIRYLELLVRPCNFNTQKITLGFDPGSVYDGFSILSKYIHHENFELIHNKNIKKRMDVRRGYRRTRRGRFRNRPCRFDWRISKKLVPTLRSMYDFRVWLFNQISQLVPISMMVYEKPKFDFYKKNFGAYATQVMQGLEKFVEYLKIKGIEIVSKSGYETKERRVELFGEDKKNFSKSSKSFFTHCIDSFALASMSYSIWNGLRIAIRHLNKKTRIINKIHYIRRELHQEKKLYSTKNKPNQHLYRIMRKGGIPEYLEEYEGKKKIVRVQKYQGSFREFDVIDQGRDLKFHKFRKLYGGTVYDGISKYSKYIDLVTGFLVCTISAGLCKKVANDRNRYKLIGYKRQNIEVVDRQESLGKFNRSFFRRPVEFA